MDLRRPLGERIQTDPINMHFDKYLESTTCLAPLQMHHCRDETERKGGGGGGGRGGSEVNVI